MRTTPPRRRWMLLVALAFFLLAGPAHSQVALAPGDPAPRISGITFPERQRFEADWGAGTLTLVNFWAAWCAPCKKEMPALQELYEANRDRGLAVLGVFERGEPAEAVKAFLEQIPVGYTIVEPDAPVDFYWGGIALRPTSFLINGEGRILRKYVGADDDLTAGLEADVEAVLDGRPLPAQVLPKGPVLPEAQEEILKKKGKGTLPGR